VVHKKVAVSFPGGQVGERRDVVEIGEHYTLTITDVALPAGRGVGRLGDLVVFMPGGLPGDRWEVRINRLEKHLAYAEPLRLEEASGHRRPVRCLHAAECGGCAFQALSYEAQLEIKQNHLVQVLKRIGGPGCANLPVSPIVPSPDEFFYRSKIELSFAQTDAGAVVGLSEGASPIHPHAAAVTPVAACLLFSPVLERILPVVRAFIEETRCAGYDEATGTGTLKRLVIREGKQTGEVMVAIIAQTDIDDLVAGLASRLVQACPEVKSVYAVCGDRRRCVHGRPHIDEGLYGLTVKVYPASFFQPNPKAAEELYGRMLSLMELRGRERLLGLYCGAGSIELLLARYAGEVTGIDASAESIAAAKENASTNGITNCTFITDRAERTPARLGRRRPDVVVVDPPRSGLSREALDVVRRVRAPRLVYVSCNPSTLARDLKALMRDYTVQHIVPFDFFPQTSHFEVLTVLRRV
jgi:23S rRNA (uracil1939-C5)-methyltransferase